MMRVLAVTMVMAGCGGGPDPYDLDFDIPRTEAFADRLSAYGLLEDPAASLVPAAGFWSTSSPPSCTRTTRTNSGS